MGLTYITETADRKQDELWHIAVADRVPLFDPMLTQFVCVRCDRTFPSRHDLETHQTEVHNFQPPLLKLFDQRQPHLLVVKDFTTFQELCTENVDSIRYLNGARWDAIEQDELFSRNFWSHRFRVEIKLIGKNQEETRHLIRLEETDTESVSTVSDQFNSMFAKQKEFSWEQIIDFEAKPIAMGRGSYKRALANYLRGVKFRNKEFEANNARQESYKEAFNWAYSELRFYDDTLSKVIVALINLSRSDFSTRRPTGANKIDFLTSVFFELKEFGASAAELATEKKKRFAVAPTDRSIDMLLQLSEASDHLVYSEKLNELSIVNGFMQNEIDLAKILFLWKFKDKNPAMYTEVISEFIHNVTFKKFIEARRINE